MAKAKEHIGFGFDPPESKHHFLVVIPKTSTGRVFIYERFEWGSEDENPDLLTGQKTLFDSPEQKIDQRFDRLKCGLSKKNGKKLNQHYVQSSI